MKWVGTAEPTSDSAGRVEGMQTFGFIIWGIGVLGLMALSVVGLYALWGLWPALAVTAAWAVVVGGAMIEAS